MLDIRIREAEPSDLPTILSLYAQPDMDNGQVLNHEEAQKTFDRIRGYPDYKVYVAETERRIVATFGLLIMDKLAHNGAPLGIVDSVKVDSDWQARGIGKLLMQFAMERCRDAGCYKISLSSNLKRTDAHRFYESLGFKKHGYSYVVEFTP